MENAVAAKKKLTEHVNQLLFHAPEQEDEVVNSSEAIADLIVMLNAAEILAEDVTYKNDGMYACLQQLQHVQYKLGKIITCVQSKIHCFRSSLKVGRAFMERLPDELGRKILLELGTWMAKWIYEVQ